MACVICNDDEHGGMYTSGDGYNDGPKVGVKVGPFLHYCWKHADKAPDLSKEIDAAFAAKNLCGFLEAWIGRCMNGKPCSKHTVQLCWLCKQPAIRNCAETLTLVCGVPECAAHPHIHRER